jgi:hypothetical protein
MNTIRNVCACGVAAALPLVTGNAISQSPAVKEDKAQMKAEKAADQKLAADRQLTY